MDRLNISAAVDVSSVLWPSQSSNTELSKWERQSVTCLTRSWCYAPRTTPVIYTSRHFTSSFSFALLHLFSQTMMSHFLDNSLFFPQKGARPAHKTWSNTCKLLNGSIMKLGHRSRDPWERVSYSSTRRLERRMQVDALRRASNLMINFLGEEAFRHPLKDFAPIIAFQPTPISILL